MVVRISPIASRNLLLWQAGNLMGRDLPFMTLLFTFS